MLLTNALKLHSGQALVPEPGFEPGPSCEERILSRIERGGESIFH